MTMSTLVHWDQTGAAYENVGLNNTLKSSSLLAIDNFEQQLSVINGYTKFESV